MNKKTLKYIKSDVYRYYGKCSNFFLICAFLKSPLIRFHFALRMSQSQGITKFVGKIFYRLNSLRKQIQISPRTSIGYGLYIGHGGPIIINHTAVIGSNVNLSQFTTIGSNEGHAAIIGDNVYIGPNCCIVEDVHIGDNATIGAGSVVTKDIPENATACGNYAKVINYNNPGRYTMNNRWNDCD